MLDLAVGCVVELNTRDVGVVVDMNGRNPGRPVIRLLWDRDRHPLADSVELDLAKHQRVDVVRILDRPSAVVSR